MKNKWIRKVLSCVLAGAMTLCLTAAAGMPATVWAEEEGGGKYVSDVFIAYGKTEDKAKAWLTKNGWEPVKGDFNAGKASFFDDNKIQDQNVAAVMGIKRTDNEDNAITDMAVMNMTGGYSLPQYQELVKQKKAEINEFINNFQVVIEEYRANYNKEGSALGQQRAQIAHDMLNKFYDGNPEDPVGLHDTGMKLGDFFLAPTRQEGEENGGDLEQMILESSGPAMLIVETFLALGADSSEDTWLERASGLTGDELSENLPKYVPEAEGQDVAPSAVAQYLVQRYGDTAVVLTEQWSEIHEEMKWYESYSNEHDLWQKDGEDAEAYAARRAEYFKGTADESGISEEEDRYNQADILYNNLYEVKYEGEWGETLGDFFNPAGSDAFSTVTESFLPMAAALSPGQRAALDYLSLNMLLNIGFGDEEAFESALPDIKKLFGEAEEMDIFTGVNREAFRSGVAITSEALMEQNAGKGQAFDRIWDHTGIVAITSYAAAAVGVISLIAGRVMVAKGYDFGLYDIQRIRARLQSFDAAERQAARIDLRQAYRNADVTKMGVAGRWVMGIGGALLIGAAIVKGVQMWKYYQRTMKPIPRMIVDESDIVTYLTDDKGKPLLDENGNQKKNIDFNTYEYYTAVKCNRPDVGEIGDWQDGVKEYQDHGCFDVADLNADMGQEWLALYTVKSSTKGDPILADSLTLQYGKESMPKSCTKGLHLFTYTNAVDLGDTAWAFNNDKKGVRFYWNVDENAFATGTASGFTGGNLALAAIGGLILGIAGSTAVWLPKRRKEEKGEEAA